MLLNTASASKKMRHLAGTKKSFKLKTKKKKQMINILCITHNKSPYGYVMLYIANLYFVQL